MKYDCDVLIIGGGIAGLSAALTASHHNLKTILVEKHENIGGKASPITKNGFTFDPGPSICIMKWIYEELFEQTGADLKNYIQFEKIDPICSFITENGNTYTLPQGKEKFIKTIEKYAPNDTVGFEKLWTLSETLYPIVKKTFFKKSYARLLDLVSPKFIPLIKHTVLLKEYKKIIDEWFTNPILKAWLYSFPTYTGQSYKTIAPGAILIPYIMVNEGIFYPKGGINAIPKAIEKRAKETGAIILTKRAVTQIKHKNKTIYAVELSTGETIYPKTVISAIDQFETEKLLKISSKPTPSYSYITLQIGINKKIPTLTHHTSCIPNDYQKYYEELYVKKTFPKNPVLYIHTPSATDPQCAPHEHESLFIVIPTHTCAENWDKIETNLTQNILNLLKKYNIYIKKENIVFERLQTPNYFAKAHANYRGSLFGPEETKRLLKILPPSNTLKTIKNLALCGGGIQPGAGMPMVTLSGKFAADYIKTMI